MTNWLLEQCNKFLTNWRICFLQRQIYFQYWRIHFRNKRLNIVGFIHVISLKEKYSIEFCYPTHPWLLLRGKYFTFLLFIKLLKDLLLVSNLYKLSFWFVEGITYFTTFLNKHIDSYSQTLFVISHQPL